MKLHLNYFAAILSMVFFANFVHAQTPEGFSWQEVENVDFGDGANHFSIEAASEGFGGEVELRLDAADGSVIGRTFFHHTGDTTYFLPYECDLNQTVSGVHEVYMNFLDYAESSTEKKLKVGSYQFSMIEDEPLPSGDRLHIYPPVPGLDSSPYYDIYIQKVSELNSGDLASVTNWETPFAWFSQCVDNTSGDDDNYYSRFIGGWSHTYTNFELDINTTIVVKIVRKDNISDGAPAGPISKAAVKPAHNVDSWEIIDGDVYVTMSNPALVAVDIDGQLDDMVGPRNLPDGWPNNAFPYNTKENGVHSVTIFANPFIDDKPNPSDAGVLVVEAGKKIPDNIDQLDWDILYFEPGVHKTSVDDVGGELVERRWEASDMITLLDNRSYYIPGDAIVYGNFTDINSGGSSENIRVYGHGVISGLKILHHKHWDDYPDSEYPNAKWHRPLYVSNAKNIHYEGITADDPAQHTFALHSSVKDEYPANTIKWCKEIGWRGNSDALTVDGNLIVEDCFLRAQDDGLYIGGAHTLRRVVFWHDANGCSLRGDRIASRYSQDNASNIPKLIVHEDIDHIYERGVFITTTNKPLYAFIELLDGNLKSGTTIAPGVKNTGQMLIFRNLMASDPNPTRGMFSFSHMSSTDDLAGIRFENMEYSGEQAFGWKKQGFLGGPNSAVRNFVFDNVIMNGEKMDQKYVDENFMTNEYVFDMTFRRHDTISGAILTSTATNGFITVDTTSGSNVATLTATPNEGYDFAGWSGNLSGTEDSTTITMDSDKSVTANFGIKRFTISVTQPSKGTIVIEPLADLYEYGQEVMARFVPDMGYSLDSWGGDLSGTENTVIIEMTSDISISATVKAAPTYMLNVNTAYGVVVLDPPGGEYNAGTIVTLTPQANSGYYFEQWLGDMEGTGNPGTITMDSDKTVNARFVYSGYNQISNAINYAGPDYVAVDGTLFTGADISASASTTATITGTEDETLYQTENWGNTLSINFPVTNGKYQVTLMFAETHFSSSGRRVFNVALEGNEIISDLDIYAKVGGDAAYNETHEVTISDGEINIDFTATVNNAKICAIKIMSDVFEGQGYTLTTGIASNGTISVDPSEGPYPEGSNVLVTALPDEHYKLDSWGGDLTGSENPTYIYMDGDKNISALFDDLTNIVELGQSGEDNMHVYPNPITSEASIEYTLDKASYVELVIYNLTGQKMATLVNTRQNAGSHLAKWIPRDENGNDLTRGIYICYLRTNDKGIQMKKVSLIK